MKKIATLLPLLALASLLTGCATEKTRPLAQRGWIGGEYTLAKPGSFFVSFTRSPGVVGTLPKTVSAIQPAAILVTQLGTNTPASLAGLRKGDWLLELNHHPVTHLRSFQRQIDESTPGTTLAIQAFRDGQTLECTVPVGREKFRTGGVLSFALPTVVHHWDLWPDPGFSLVVVGFEPNPGVRKELQKNHEIYDEEWNAFLGIIEVSKGKHIVSQEPFMASTEK